MFCMCLVVVGHAFGHILSVMKDATPQNRPPISVNLLAFIYGMTKVAVPVFLMITGFLLLDKASETADPIALVGKRLRTLLPPFLFWSVFYRVFIAYWYHVPDFSLYKVYDVILEPANYQLWYFFDVFAIHLMLPIFGAFFRNTALSGYNMPLLLWLYCVVVFMVQNASFAYGFRMPLFKLAGTFPSLVGFCFFGKIVRDRSIKWIADATLKQALVFAGLAYGLSALLLRSNYLTLCASDPDHRPSVFGEQYYSPGITLLSCAVFVVFEKLNNHPWLQMESIPFRWAPPSSSSLSSSPPPPPSAVSLGTAAAAAASEQGGSPGASASSSSLAALTSAGAPVGSGHLHLPVSGSHSHSHSTSSNKPSLLHVPAKQLIHTFSQTSFGVFLAHPLLLELCVAVVGQHVDPYDPASEVKLVTPTAAALSALVAIVGSSYLSIVLKRIPLMKNVV